MGWAKAIAPIFPVRDLDIALAHYARLGFATRGSAVVATDLP
jgi:hypothetical protein